MVTKGQKYVVKNHFQGIPKLDDFEIIKFELPPIKDGEILVKAQWISVDPYQRLYNAQHSPPFDQFGFQIGEVLDSKDPTYPAGTKVVSHKGWCDHYIANASQLSNINRIYKLPELKGLPDSYSLGIVGMPGASAYFGLLEICKPKAGETVVVTGAAGAVGSLVGQIAKIKGCRVIGFAGSDDKVEWLEKELGFDKALNYKTVEVAAALKEAAPNGVDCFFDNVGGEISSTIINQMNVFGRISVCGSISSYNETSLPAATIMQPALVMKQLKCEGFLALRWLDKCNDAFDELAKWINSGQLKPREYVTEGFDNIFNAFTGMLAGDNIGKAVVRV